MLKIILQIEHRLNETSVQVYLLEKRYIICGIFLILFGIFTNAATLEGNCSTVTNQCDLSIKELELCNNSGSTETYQVRVEGEVANWVNVIPSNVTLSPGECKQLRIYTISNCYAEPGTYSVDIVVSNDSAEKVGCEIEITQGHYVEVGVEPAEQIATQCEAKSYDIILYNNSTVQHQQTEKVYIEIDGLPESWYTLEEDTVLVSKDEPEIVELTVQPPCDAALGEYVFEVETSLINPTFVNSATAIHVISQGQEFLIDTKESYEACLEEETQREISITNLGKMDDEVELELQGPVWVRLSDYDLVMESGETKDIALIFATTADSEGSYGVTITVVSKNFDYETSGEFEVNLKDCYGVEIEKLQGAVSVCAEDSPEYIFRLTNNRTKDIDVDISISGIDADLSTDFLSLSPGEGAEIEVELDVSNIISETSVTKRDVAIEIIMDTSGSMMERVNGERKIDAAKEAITFFANNITEVNLGLRVFGQEEGCAESELLVPISQLNIAEITESVGEFTPIGLTPIAASLEDAINDFKGGKEKNIILVSDGKETCEGNLESVANRLASEGITVYTVGFDIDEKGKEQLEMIASETDGMYFDAGNSDELLEVFQQITRELDIVPGGKGEKLFSLNLQSDKFSYSEDFTIEISDCYNAVLSVPAVNLCRGVSSADFLGINNLGTRSQTFEISIEPEWIEFEADAELNGNSEVLIPITLNVPLDATEEYITVRAVSKQLELVESKPINYLSDASCYGIDLIILNYELDAAACEGKTQTLILENRGMTEQVVSLSADKEWVYFDEETVEVGKGERRGVYFLISPPLDLTEEESLITIIAESDFGFKTEATIKINIVGPGFGIEPVEVEITDVNLTKVIEAMAVDVEVQFELLNDSNRTMHIFSVEALNYNAAFEVENTTLGKLEKTKVKMLLDLPEDYTKEEVEVSISVKTDEGTFTRIIKFTMPSAEQPEEEEVVEVTETVPVGVGLFTLENARNGAILILLVIVIGLIVYSILKATEATKPWKRKPSLEEEVEKIKKPRKKSKRKKKK